MSCNKNLYITDDILYVTDDTINNATVLGRNISCGSLFLIKFDDDVYLLPINTSDNIFYGINLPKEYKIKGIRIKVEFREPFNDEVKPCRAMGLSYPQIYITKIEWTENLNQYNR